MSRRYDCDYCLRSFKDLPQSRRKHLRSTDHLMAKKCYYESIKTAADHLRDELNKSVCNHYFRHNFCKFGDNCIHSHLTYDRLQELRHQAIAERMDSRRMAAMSPNVSQVSGFDAKTHLDVWLRKRFNTTDSESARDNDRTFDVINIRHNLQELKQLFETLDTRQIPISLIPPSIEDFNQSEECEWK